MMAGSCFSADEYRYRTATKIALFLMVMIMMIMHNNANIVTPVPEHVADGE